MSAASASEPAMKIETIVKTKNFAVVLFIINLRPDVSIVLSSELDLRHASASEMVFKTPKDKPLNRIFKLDTRFFKSRQIDAF